MSIFALGGGKWFMKDGSLVSTGREEKPGALRTLVAVDGTSRRGWLATLASRSPEPLSDAKVADILRERGAANAIQLPGESFRLSAPHDSSQWIPPPEPVAARTALLAVNKPLNLTLATGDRFRRLRFLLADGTSNLRGTNPPRAAIDGRIASHPSANHFWAGPVVGEFSRGDNNGKPWLELTLEPEAWLGVVDIYHAENAGFSSHFNLRGYRVLGRENTAQEWELLFDILHDAPVNRERHRLDPPRPISHLRLEVTDAGFLPDMSAARLAEVIAWGEVRSHRGTLELE